MFIVLSQICRDDVDFFVKKGSSEGELESQLSDEFYPPRFKVFFSSTKENDTFIDGKIAFTGATSNLEFNMHLDLHDSVNPANSSASKFQYFYLKYYFIVAVDAGTQTEGQTVSAGKISWTFICFCINNIIFHSTISCEYNFLDQPTWYDKQSFCYSGALSFIECGSILTCMLMQISIKTRTLLRDTFNI